MKVCLEFQPQDGPDSVPVWNRWTLEDLEKNKDVKYFSFWMHKYSNAKLKGFSFHRASCLRALFIQSQGYFSTEKNPIPCHKTSAVCKDLFWKASCRHSAMHPKGFITFSWLTLSKSSFCRLGGTLQSEKAFCTLVWRAKFLQSQQRAWIFTFNFIEL